VKPGQWFQVDTQTHSLEVAISGLGIAMARRPIVNDYLSRGDLVAPFGIAHSTGYSYYLVTDPSARKRKAVEGFRDYILSQYLCGTTVIVRRKPADDEKRRRPCTTFS